MYQLDRIWLKAYRKNKDFLLKNYFRGFWSTTNKKKMSRQSQILYIYRIYDEIIAIYS